MTYISPAVEDDIDVLVVNVDVVIRSFSTCKKKRVKRLKARFFY